jgi:hypothetical protein
MKKIFIASLLIFTPVLFLSASSIKGVSLGEFASCSYYLIEDSSGDYTLAEWYGGITPYEGDVLYGELHSYGFKDLYNITRDNSTRVWIDDYLLSEDRATEKLIDECGWDREILNYFGNTSYYPSSYTQPPRVSPPTISCPVNSTLNSSDSKCYCNSGYSINSNGNACVVNMPTCTANSSRRADNQCYCDTSFTRVGDRCISYTEKCQLTYGSNSYGTETNCYCSNGYIFNSAGNYCVLKPVTVTTNPVPNNVSANKLTTDLTEPAVSKKEIKTITTKTNIPKTKTIKSQLSSTTISAKASTTIETPNSKTKIDPKISWFNRLFGWFK